MRQKLKSYGVALDQDLPQLSVPIMLTPIAEHRSNSSEPRIQLNADPRNTRHLLLKMISHGGLWPAVPVVSLVCLPLPRYLHANCVVWLH